MTGALSALVSLLIAAAAPSAVPAGYQAVDPENLLVVDTTKGRVLIEMRPETAPATVARVKLLARKGFYDGDVFYRVNPGYLAQTGARTTAGAALSGEGPVPDEFQFTPSAELQRSLASARIEASFLGSLPTAFQGAGAATVRFCPGVAAMAHYAEPGSGDSQIFITTAATPGLEHAYSAWGRVVSGLEAVRALAPGQPPAAPDGVTRVRVAADLPAAERPSVAIALPDSEAFKAAVARAGAAKGPKPDVCAVEVPVEVHQPH